MKKKKIVELIKTSKKRKLKTENNKGITLVSLVVTIIVLIILTGISINLVLGENSILKKAIEARKAQKIGEVKERLSLEIAGAETEAILRNEKLEQKQLEDIINKYGILKEDKDTIVTKEGNYEISLKEIYYGVLSESGSYSDKVEQVELLEKEIEELKTNIESLESQIAGMKPKRVKLGSCSNTATFDVKSYEGWQNFTNENFAMIVTEISMSGTYWSLPQTFNQNVSVSYNADTGIVTVYTVRKSHGMGGPGDYNVTAQADVICDVYLYY